ncbi:MAG: hypothetical protein ACUVXE_05725 [Anaerolineae bacterium]
MRKGIWIILGSLLGVILVGCLARPEITPLPPSPMLPSVPTREATSAPPTETPAPQADSSTCIACHTDEETVKALAKEPEKAEHLSEGEG